MKIHCIWMIGLAILAVARPGATAAGLPVLTGARAALGPLVPAALAAVPAA